MGLIEHEWLATINIMLVKTGFKYIDFVEKALELVKYFKADGCDLIIAITHMRTYNDK
jgi:2',3'-cyclic-nucleotide 2'-phosphodiesterase (5'-nucleotidase family)